MSRAVGFALLLTVAGWAQSSPHFEVASVRPSPDIRTVMASGVRPNIGITVDGQRASFGFATLQNLIAYAYGVKPYQVNGPAWMSSERFDIQATLPPGATKADVPEMLQALLAQRFELASHRDDQPQPVYDLRVAPGGIKMKPAAPATSAPAAAPSPSPGGTTTTVNGMQVHTSGAGSNRSISVTGGKQGPMSMTMSNGMMHMSIGRMSMAQLAQTLSSMADRPVIDHTGLNGSYQVTLDISQQDMMAAAQRVLGSALPQPAPAGNGAGGAQAPAPAGSSILTSVDALGLRLVKANEALGQVKIDHIDKMPTSN